MSNNTANLSPPSARPRRVSIRGTIFAQTSNRTLALGIQAFQIDCLNRAEQAATFSGNIRAEIIDPLKLMLKEEDSLTKSLGAQMGKLAKEIAVVESGLQSMRKNYEKQLKEAEDALYACEDCRRNSLERTKTDPQLPEKLNARMAAVLKSHKDAAEAYRTFCRFAASAKEKYSGELSSVLDIFQRQEEQRIDVLKASFQKFFVYETSVEMNHRCDIKHVAATVEDINKENDIKTLIHRETVYSGQKDHTPALSGTDPKKSDWDRLFELYSERYYGKEDRLDYENLVEETKDYIAREETKDFKTGLQSFQTIFREVLWKSGMAEPDQTLSAGSLLEHRWGRLAFSDAMAEYVSAGKTAVAKSEGMQLLGDFLSVFLNNVFAPHDG